MKATIIETKKQFEPIEIKLVIESEEELCSLWHRLNAGESSFRHQVYSGHDKLKHDVNVDTSYDFWEVVKNAVENRKLKLKK